TGKILSKILEKEFNHQVTCVISGSEALAELSKSMFDVVFMDIDMPEQSGVETSLKIRNTSIALQENRQIPILAYTTNNWDEEFMKAGMNGYVDKPANPAKVQAVLEKVSCR
ncbi:204_t:CDS:2, partial [Acaulospora morrowiae]